MENFKALAKQIKKVDPTRIDMDDYTPSNKPQTCPPVSDVWDVSGASLPPVPDEKVCECMYAKLSCVPKSNLDPEEYGAIFGFICGLEDGKYCKDITGNTSTGKYGAFGMCHDEQKLGYVMDQYSQAIGEGACDFEGQATQVEPEAENDECESKLTEATEAANVGGGGDGEEDNSAGVRVGPAAAMAAWVVVALGVGASMVL